MGNRFHGLRHHAVVGGHYQNHDVGGLRTACTHSGKRFVARRVQERYHAFGRFHMVCANVLRDTASFARHHFTAADVVQQRGFTVVHVTHHGYDGWTRQHFGIDRLGFVQEGIWVVNRGRFADVPHFFHHQQGGVLVERLVDGYHHAHFHQGFNDFHAFHGHFVCQIGHGNGFGHQDFVHHGFGRRLETMLVRLEFEFFAFFAAAHAFVVAATAARIFAFFAAAAAAVVVIVAAVAAVVFFAAAAGRIVAALARRFAGGRFAAGSFRQFVFLGFLRQFFFARFGGTHTFTVFAVFFGSGGQSGFFGSLRFGGFAACLAFGAFLFLARQGFLGFAHFGGTVGFFGTACGFFGVHHFNGRWQWFVGFGFCFGFAAAFAFSAFGRFVAVLCRLLFGFRRRFRHRFCGFRFHFGRRGFFGFGGFAASFHAFCFGLCGGTFGFAFRICCRHFWCGFNGRCRLLFGCRLLLFGRLTGFVGQQLRHHFFTG